jgi:calcium-independent phospholipase A2
MQNFQSSLVEQAMYAFSATREVTARSRRGSVADGADDMSMEIGSAPNTPRGNGTNGNTNLDAQIGGRVLCLDGGGIRGVVLTQTLLYMQKVFEVPIVELFDWIAGTSTGGILALCLASGKSVSEILCLYMRFKDKVFTGERPYSSEALEDFLKNELGPSTKMADLRRPRYA